MDIKLYCENEVLHDGSSVIVRAIQPDDKNALREAFYELSRESVRFRFFQMKHSLSDQELEYFTEIDFLTHVALGIGLLEEEDIIPIGIGRYIVDQSDPTKAEIAFTVDDAYQGFGVGSLLLKHLSRIAKVKGVEEFHASVLETNEKMIRVLRRSEVSKKESQESGLIDFSLRLK
jgi:GNAT superfamily N-acetyltransferase